MTDIDAGKTPVAGKRALFSMDDEKGGTVQWPCKILDNYGSARTAPVGDPAYRANEFCTKTTLAADGQTLVRLKVETATADFRVDAYEDPERSPGTYSGYEAADLKEAK